MATRCTQCLWRYCERGSTCRTCLRESGIDTRTVFQFEQERQERQREKLARLARVNLDPPPRPVIRTFVERGIEYGVVWDGSIR